jgi:uncharacterized membrane protein required for colicin V production
MNGLDLVLAILLLAPAAAGLWRGVLQPAAALVGLLGGGLLGVLYAGAVAGQLFDWGDEQGWAELLVFAGIFLGAIVMAAVAARILDGLLRKTGLKWIDRLGGMALGIGVGILIGAVLVVAAAALLPEESVVVEESLLAPHVVRVAKEGAGLLPEGWRERFLERVRRITGNGEEPAETPP